MNAVERIFSGHRCFFAAPEPTFADSGQNSRILRLRFLKFAVIFAVRRKYRQSAISSRQSALGTRLDQKKLAAGQTSYEATKLRSGKANATAKKLRATNA